MGRRVTINIQGQPHEGEEVDFQTMHEDWNEYACSDGSTVKLKAVVTRIVRLDDKDQNGDPRYLTQSNNVLAVTHPRKA